MKLTIATTINGRAQEVQVLSSQTLLEFLRDDLKLKGAVEGCSVGVCGSCPVLIDGKPVSSCLTLASNIEDKQVTTIEGLAQNGDLDPVQQAFLEHQPSNAASAPPA
jgi:aerobic carbon-monoxide dehydrogenase small subunit